MSARTWIAVLLLINYLLVIGMGCISRTEDQSGFVMIQYTDQGSTYQECLYLRMGGLENFLAESLASQYKSGPSTPKHHIISVVPGIDSHYLAQSTWRLPEPYYRFVVRPAMTRQSPVPVGVNRAVHSPPWLG